jgi:hypothetical protein
MWLMTSLFVVSNILRKAWYSTVPRLKIVGMDYRARKWLDKGVAVEK